MPIISSPIDGSPMRELERYGVKIDFCTTSGGIWLDKGELEKIIMMVREEALAEVSAPPPPPSGYQQETYYEEEPQYREEQRPRRKKKDSIFESLLDIFD